MGCLCSRNKQQPTQLHNYTVIRAIGRGAFGKVCIVQHRTTKKYYAIKYMSKKRCVRMRMGENILKELAIHTLLDHPFIVNLHSSFQDESYMYIVSDLLLGGDLRYHLNRDGTFKEDRSKLYVCEIALAVEYLHTQNIIHRDIKPDNIILDEAGHAHLTDFNLATKLERNLLATSFSGTRPYMAPEIFECSIGKCNGYDDRVDWWSLGVTFYEMLWGRAPFPLSSQLSTEQVLIILQSELRFPSHWTNDLISFLSKLLAPAARRPSTLADISAHTYMSRTDLNWVLAKRAAPSFVPSQHGLNCDPLYEIEERVLVSTPHLRRKGPEEVNEDDLRTLANSFISYSRNIP